MQYRGGTRYSAARRQIPDLARIRAVNTARAPERPDHV